MWMETGGTFDILGLPHGSPVSFIDNHLVVGAGLAGLAGGDRVKWSGGSAGQYNENGILYGTSTDEATKFLDAQTAKGLLWDGNAWVPKDVMIQEAVAASRARGTSSVMLPVDGLPPWLVPAAVVAAIGLIGLAVWKRSRRVKKK